MTYSNRPHKRLEVWKRSMNLAADIHRRTEKFPKREDFGISAQMRKCAVSIPSNTAEGLAKATVPDKLKFLQTAQGSLSELDTQVELCGMIGYLDVDSVREILAAIQDIQMLLSGLIRKIRSQGL